VVALVSSYFDDSETLGDIWVVGGYAGYVNQWEHFDRLWVAALDTHGVPYFHMREMGKPNGKFAKWHPPEDHQDEVTAFFKDLVNAIRASGLRMFGSAIWFKDLERFNREKNIQIKPYPLAAYACLTQVAQYYSKLPNTTKASRLGRFLTAQTRLMTSWQLRAFTQRAINFCFRVPAISLRARR
jgi:hypothetical protein